MSPLIGSPRRFFRSGLVAASEFPNLPSNHEVISDNPWTSISPLPPLWTRLAGADHIVADPTDPNGDGLVLEMPYTPTVPTAGSAPCNVAINPTNMGLFSGGKYYKELGLGYYFKVSDNFVMNDPSSASGIFKQHFWGHDLSSGMERDDTYTCIIGVGLGQIGFELRFQGLELGSPDQSNNVGASMNVAASHVTRGLWKKVEVIIRTNTPGIRDGEGLVFMDDLPTHHATGCGWADVGSNGRMTAYRISPTMGGQGWLAGTHPPATQQMWYSRSYVTGLRMP